MADEQSPPKRPPANTMPGGSAHTAGGPRGDGGGATLWEALKMFRLSDFKTFFQKPCRREGLLTGIEVGFGGAAVGAILRRTLAMGWSLDTLPVLCARTSQLEC